MSLTSFVKIPDVQERFRQEFRRPIRPHPKTLLIDPQVAKAYRGRLGTAFDYLVRFALQRRYPTAVPRSWVAERGLELVQGLDWPKGPRRLKSAIRCAEGYMERAKRDHATYLAKGEVTDELLASVWRLAYLETFCRVPPPISRMLLMRDEVALGSGAKELRDLLALAPLQQWEPRELLALNPTFGDASLLVGGADADLVVDETLVDFKTNVNPGLPREAFNQLIGYAALAEIGGVNGHRRRVQHFELYLARYGTSYRYDRQEVVSEKRWPPFLEWLQQRAQQANTPEARREAYIKAVMKYLPG